VIEVLNTPSISSPIPQPISTLGEKDTPVTDEKQAAVESAPASEPVQPVSTDDADKVESTSQGEAPAGDVGEAQNQQVAGDVEMRDDRAAAAPAPASVGNAAEEPVKQDDIAPTQASSDIAPVTEAAESGADKPEEKETEAEATTAAVEATSTSAPTPPAKAPKSDGDVIMEEAPVAPVSELKEAAAEAETRVVESSQGAVADQAPENESTEASKPEEKGAEKEEGEV
jgi:hypothetical protein